MQAIDNALLRAILDARGDFPLLWTAARWLTELGGWIALTGFTLLICVWLIWRGEPRRAAALLLVGFGGRALVELLKWGTDRPRPGFADPTVTVHSLSFPSGHAANSMIVYLAVALIAANGRRPVIVAALLAICIGLTRPMLGVHWPSDIVAGWCVGTAWTLGAVWAMSRWMEGRPFGRPRHVRR